MMPITPSTQAIALIQAQLHDTTPEGDLCDTYAGILTALWHSTIQHHPDNPHDWAVYTAANLLVTAHRHTTDPDLAAALVRTAGLFALAWDDELTAATTHTPDNLDDLELYDD